MSLFKNWLRKYKVDIILIFIVGVYYLFYVNKGLVVSDEGYFTTIAWLISKGKKPYLDVYLQYPPVFLYVLALFYKLFSNTLITGRILAYTLNLLILAFSLILLNEYKRGSIKLKVFTTFIIAAFGFPLINIPLNVTLCVFLSIILIIFLNKWVKSKAFNKKYLIYAGIALGVLFGTKQNVGLSFFLAVNTLVFIGGRGNIIDKIKNLIYLNIPVISINFVWIYYFFLAQARFEEFIYFINYGKRIFVMFPPLFPPFKLILQPTGIFKLLPYYLPIILFVITIYVFVKKKTINYLVLILPYAGLFANTFPVSDLLHLYPFLGLSLLSFVIVSVKIEIVGKKYLLLLILLTSLSGYYIANFRGHYRYNKPYKYQNSTINLPTARYIKTDKITANSINETSSFIDERLKDEDIFVYSYAPIMYFLLEKEPPIDYINLYPGNLTHDEERDVIQELKSKNISYILSEGKPSFDTPISKWISDQEIIFKSPLYYIYKVWK